MKPIAIFYHCLFYMDSPDNLLMPAVNITKEQMSLLWYTELIPTARELHVGINGGGESAQMANLLIPSSAKIKLHGLQCHTENRTIRMLEEWLPGKDDWYVLYFHAKGASHPDGHSFTTIWRNCMTHHCIRNWGQCVHDLDAGYDAVGCHWMTPPAS